MLRLADSSSTPTNMDREETLELQAEFNQLNRRDKQVMRKWFEDYPELTISEHAIVMDRTEAQVKDLRGSLKLTTTRVIELGDRLVRLDRQQHKKEIPKAPKTGTDSWVIDQIINKGETIKTVAAALKKSRFQIRGILKSYDKYSYEQTVHPCKNLEWLTEHYVKQMLSLVNCGKLAGVSSVTILSWLATFKIPARDAFESYHAVLDKKTNDAAGRAPDSDQSPAQI
jgi:hypothetical protein